jgi:hypothetical protein
MDVEGRLNIYLSIREYLIHLLECTDVQLSNNPAASDEIFGDHSIGHILRNASESLELVNQAIEILRPQLSDEALLTLKGRL